MNIWIIVAIVGLLVIAGVATISMTHAETASVKGSCGASGCTGSCTASSNCGSASCGATTGGKCTCGK
jgi:hypothetical protein